MISNTNATISHLVTLLTRPLAFVYAAQTVAQLELFLHANLASVVSTHQAISPFTLLLSPTHLPPTPIYAACLQAGIEWATWIRALGDKVLYVFITEGCLKLRIGETGEVVTLWEEDPSDYEVPMISKIRNRDAPMIQKLKGILDSARERTTQQLEQPISLPTLFSLPASADDDDECMSDSDSESTTSSSRFSEISSAESMTSVSSSGSISPPKKTSVYIPPAKAAKLAAALHSDSDSSIPSHRLSSLRSQRRSAPIPVAQNKPRTRYTYQGGETGVVTGGVMLGKSSASAKVASPLAATATREPLRKSSRKHTGTVMLGPDSVANWRRVRA